MEFMEVFLPMPNTNFWYNEMLCKIVIHENLRQKFLIFRVMCFTIYGPKNREAHDTKYQKFLALFLRNFFHKTLPIISKLYASASVHQWIIYGSLWGPPGHGSIAILNLDTLLEVLCDKFGQNWRKFSQF